MQLEKEKALGKCFSDRSQPVRCLVIPGTAEVCGREEMAKKREGKMHAEFRFCCLRILKYLGSHLEYLNYAIICGCLKTCKAWSCL